MNSLRGHNPQTPGSPVSAEPEQMPAPVSRGITVVTVSLNAADTLRCCLESLLEQELPPGWHWDHVLIDGGSSDHTVSVGREVLGLRTEVISERDEGIYHAMNKGLWHARGEIIGFLNADDHYPRPDVLALVSRAFEDETVDACYADLCYVSQVHLGRIVRFWRSGEFASGRFSSGWCPPHPTFFIRRSSLERLGFFDTQYTIAADVELMMRALEVRRLKVAYIPEVLVHMRLGGTTNKSLANVWRQNREVVQALDRHGLFRGLLRFVTGKLIHRTKQFLRRPPHSPGF